MTTEEFQELGFSIINHYSRSQIVGIRRFTQLFGTTPENCKHLWEAIADLDLNPTYGQPKHLLFCFTFS